MGWAMFGEKPPQSGIRQRYSRTKSSQSTSQPSFEVMENSRSKRRAWCTSTLLPYLIGIIYKSWHGIMQAQSDKQNYHHKISNMWKYCKYVCMYIQCVYVESEKWKLILSVLRAEPFWKRSDQKMVSIRGKNLSISQTITEVMEC